ncbi:MarR family winged helix-turn-helix transcriptional regulator [Altericroceibacterium endophyticum]|uniref:MarR family transcriptional regulator n=1 Tax=Altericroceibacterium endophyticum TaxID=1808508 RepID=A0A6I4TAQ1_9SPHN|nr:MarR family transcriptional regulator [Altericroceibacterium endophyticum]MXO66835.1 MarR family transcriptional regulator [Altericroceibacterium endophyticum]
MDETDSANGISTGKRRPRILYLVRRFHSLAHARLEEITRTYDMTPAEFTMLSLVDRIVPCSSAEIARRASITPQAVTQQINQLVAKKILLRRQNPANRRINLIEITPTGRTNLSAINQRADALEQELLTDFGEQEEAAIRAFLSQAIN